MSSPQAGSYVVGSSADAWERDTPAPVRSPGRRSGDDRSAAVAAERCAGKISGLAAGSCNNRASGAKQIWEGLPMERIAAVVALLLVTFAAGDARAAIQDQPLSGKRLVLGED